MNVRPVRPDDYWAFTQLAAEPRDFRRELDRLIGFGYTAPRLWYLAEADGQPVAGVVYWALPSLPEELMLLDVALDFSRPDAAALGRELLRDSLRQLAAAGARRVEARLFSDSTDDLYEKKALYLGVGLPLIQEKESFFREFGGGAAPVPPPEGHGPSRPPDDDVMDPIGDSEGHPAPGRSPGRSSRLTYKTLAETGYSAFIDGIAAVNAQTLDRYDLWSARSEGHLPHAEEMFIALSDIDRREDYWRLAYDGDGLAGCLVPQKIDDGVGVVNYFGVVPAKRGRGYGAGLFAAGVGLLVARGLSRIVIDLDTENHPVIRIVERAGFRRDFRAWVFKTDLAGLGPA